MKKGIIIKLALWLLISIALFNVGLNMLSAPDTMQNIAGFVIIVAIWVIALETKCLTNLKFKRKHEK